MKISRTWLQAYFEQELPSAQQLSDALTFHAFEIDGIEKHGDDHILDVKVTPNRGHDCLSHRGIAKEIAAILEIPMKADPLKLQPDLTPKADTLSVHIANPALCLRFTAAHIRGVQVGPSPDWLRMHLESIGQRSINNIVDATNFVMFSLGQPVHAFDAGKLHQQDGIYALEVRHARSGESIVALDSKSYALADSMLVVADAHTGVPVGIAGVKGGLPAGIDESTTDIVVEVANFDGVSVRKTAAALKLRTDASSRFEQGLSPELAGYGLRATVNLILEIAGGTLEGFADEYPVPQQITPAAVRVSKVNSVLGTQIPMQDMERALTRLDLSHSAAGETFTITPRFERLDLVIEEDVVEEIGRIIGYDKVPQTELPAISAQPKVNANFARIESAREHMTSEGYSEVYTSVFAETGERAVLNKVGGERPYMRSNLVDGLKDALERNVRNKDLLGLTTVKLFEIGTVWRNGGEEILVGTAEEKGDIKEYSLSDVPAPEKYPAGEGSKLERYTGFSKYPFVVRDIAMWVPFDSAQGKPAVSPESIEELIRGEEGELLARIGLFDTFTKGDRTSFAFRLIFQSKEKTLTDEEVNAVMERVHATLKEKGFEIR